MKGGVNNFKEKENSVKTLFSKKIKKSYAADSIILINGSAFKHAPPTRAPSISG